MAKPVSDPGVFKSRNFMTPHVLNYYKLHKGYAELSEGDGMNRQPIYGVTVEPDTDRARSRMFHSKADALRYIDCLSSHETYRVPTTGVRHGSK